MGLRYGLSQGKGAHEQFPGGDANGFLEELLIAHVPPLGVGIVLPRQKRLPASASPPCNADAMVREIPLDAKPVLAGLEFQLACKAGRPLPVAPAAVPEFVRIRRRRQAKEHRR